MPTADIKIGENTYKITLVGGLTAYTKIAKYGGNFTQMVASLLQSNVVEFNSILAKMVEPDEIVELFNTFVQPNQLFCNGNLVLNIDEHFSGKPSDMYKLLFEAIKANDKDFFTSLPTLMENLVAQITAKLAPANSSLNPEETANQELIKENLTNLASKLKGNLSLTQ